MTPTLTFTCSICNEQSVSICVYCTKDACPNHLCDRCKRCSDCCECDIKLEEHPEYEHVPESAVETPAAEPAAEPEPVPLVAPVVVEVAPEHAPAAEVTQPPESPLEPSDQH